MTPLLEVAGLTVRLPVSGELRTVLQEISFSIGAGEALALVGESGSGKSMTARAILRLLPPGAAVEGKVTYDGGDVYALRGGRLALVQARGLDGVPGSPSPYQSRAAHRRFHDRDAAGDDVQGRGQSPRSGDARSRSASTTASAACANFPTSSRAACCRE